VPFSKLAQRRPAESLGKPAFKWQATKHPAKMIDRAPTIQSARSFGLNETAGPGLAPIAERG
jgi:hypothetical protein